MKRYAIKHGLLRDHDPLYNSWSNMIQRCTNPKHPSYRIYGGQGITVCDDWRDCAKFAEWAKANGYHPGLSIDRIDGGLGYSPGNCRWATRKEQQRNLSFNRNIEYKGRTQCLAAWAEELGMSVKALEHRLDRWGDVDRAFTKPVQTRRRGPILVEYRGRTKELHVWAEELGMNPETLRFRLTNWNDVERAFTAPVQKWTSKGVAA